MDPFRPRFRAWTYEGSTHRAGIQGRYRSRGGLHVSWSFSFLDWCVLPRSALGSGVVVLFLLGGGPHFTVVDVVALKNGGVYIRWWLLSTGV